MTKLYIYSTAITPSTGGSHTVLVNLLDHLHELSSPTIFTLLAPAEYSNLAKEKGIEHVVIDHNKKWLKRLFWEKFLGQKMIENSSDNFVLSLQNTLPKVGAQVRTAAYVHTSLCFENNVKIPITHFRDFLRKYLYTFAIRNSFAKNTILLVQTNWMKQLASKALKVPIENTFIAIPSLSLNMTLNSEQTSKARHIDENQTVLFYPAKFYYHKNHKIIFEALQIIIRRGLSSKLKIVLTLEENEIEKLKKQFLSIFLDPNITIENLGYISGVEMTDTYQRSSALLFPSILETFGLPLVEAKQFRLPILCSNLSYAKETLGDYSYTCLFDPSSPEQLANAITDSLPQIQKKLLKAPSSLENKSSLNRKNTLSEVLSGLISST